MKLLLVVKSSIYCLEAFFQELVLEKKNVFFLTTNDGQKTEMGSRRSKPMSFEMLKKSLVMHFNYFPVASQSHTERGPLAQVTFAMVVQYSRRKQSVPTSLHLCNTNTVAAHRATNGRKCSNTVINQTNVSARKQCQARLTFFHPSQAHSIL